MTRSLLSEFESKYNYQKFEFDWDRITFLTTCGGTQVLQHLGPRLLKQIEQFFELLISLDYSKRRHYLSTVDMMALFRLARNRRADQLFLYPICFS